MEVEANVPQWNPEAIWLDEANPAVRPCTGDGSYFGASGSFVRTSVAVSTDPRDPNYRLLGSTARTVVAPQLSVAEATALGQALALAPAFVVDAQPVATDDSRPASADLDARVYPNPTNATATLRLTLASAGSVTVRVLDVLGREVTRLTTDLGAGTQSVAMPVERLAPGAYVLRVETANGTATQRLTRF